MYLYLLKDEGKITHIFYDIKEAIEKAILLNLELIRLRMRGEGRVSEMLIYSPLANQGSPAS
jgi:hypothetical protein